MQNYFKSKLIVCLISLFLPGTGLHWLYLQGKKSPWLSIQCISLLIGLWGWLELAATEKTSLLGWIAVALGEISMLASWIATLAFGLRPDEKFDATFNANTTKKNTTGWFTILCIIAALLIGAFVLMAGLAIVFEQYFMSQIEAAKEISQ